MATDEEAATSITSTQNDAVRGSNPPVPPKKKRNLPGNPDPEAEVIALSPKTLMATNRFVCEICGKGFQREQNLQLHKRGHNLPWKLKQRTSKEVRKRVYVCPEKTCVHHHASRALGDLTGIKKHFCRKHGEKKWKCDKCAKHYAVHSDWKAHYKTCGTREYKCDCGTIFSRRDSFITHRAFCDALAEETARFTAASHSHTPNHFITSSLGLGQHHFPPNLPLWAAHGNQLSHDHNSIAKHLQEMHHQFTLDHPLVQNPNPPSLYQTVNWGFGRDQFPNQNPIMIPILKEVSVPSLFHAQNQNQNQSQSQSQNCAAISATALLQRAAQIGATTRDGDGDKLCGLYGTTSSGGSGLGSDVELSATLDHEMEMYPPLKRCRRPVEEEIGLGETRDFLGVGMQTICNPSAINGWI